MKVQYELYVRNMFDIVLAVLYMTLIYDYRILVATFHWYIRVIILQVSVIKRFITFSWINCLVCFKPSFLFSGCNMESLIFFLALGHKQYCINRSKTIVCHKILHKKCTIELYGTRVRQNSCISITFQGPILQILISSFGLDFSYITRRIKSTNVWAFNKIQFSIKRNKHTLPVILRFKIRYLTSHEDFRFQK